jgi:hypothetical protein
VQLKKKNKNKVESIIWASCFIIQKTCFVIPSTVDIQLKGKQKEDSYCKGKPKQKNQTPTHDKKTQCVE